LPVNGGMDLALPSRVSGTQRLFSSRKESIVSALRSAAPAGLDRRITWRSGLYRRPWSSWPRCGTLSGVKLPPGRGRSVSANRKNRRRRFS